MSILLVEDEPIIRTLMAESLEDAGFEVTQARDGDEAARIVDQSDTAVDLLVTDIQMPGLLDGLAVAARATALWPRLPIIYTTGRPDIVDAARHLGCGQTLLPKPYTPTQLLRAIEKHLKPAMPSPIGAE